MRSSLFLLLAALVILSLFSLSSCTSFPSVSTRSSASFLRSYGIPNLKWGPKGHAAVAAIAQALINSNVTAALQTLLPDSNGQMPPIASWADEIREDPAYDWSHPLHYINTPDWTCSYSRTRDCNDDTYGSNYCVDMAIQNYTSRVLDNNIGFSQQNEAIKFLVHFVGDVHQPLHCGFIGDEGGNKYKGQFEGRDWNLHAIWDDALISTRIENDFGGDTDQWTANLTSTASSLSALTLKRWTSCFMYDDAYGACSDKWGEESVKLACEYSYVETDGITHIQDGFVLGDGYYQRNIPIVEKQLMKGGIRLAYVLNNMFPAEDRENSSPKLAKE